MSRRTERISGQLRAEIARILREDCADPRVSLVTLTRVDVAPDLSHALVFWSALSPDGSEDPEAVQSALDGAAAFVRSRLAAVLTHKRVPELRFRHDRSLELGTRTLSLLREIGDGEKT